MIVQVDIGSAQQVSSPNYIICAHQTRLRIDTPDKNINNAIFDDFDVQKYYVEIDGQQNPRDSVGITYEENDYIEKYRILKLFLKEFMGEPTLNPFVSYPDMKTKYPIGILD